MLPENIKESLEYNHSLIDAYNDYDLKKAEITSERIIIPQPKMKSKVTRNRKILPQRKLNPDILKRVLKFD